MIVVCYIALFAALNMSCDDSGGEVTGNGPVKTDSTDVQVWSTSANKAALLLKDPWGINFSETGNANIPSITLNPETTFQEIDGFGAALTGSSAYVIKQYLSDEQRQSLLKQLFDAKDGIGISVLRLTIGASDFSLEDYTYDDMPSGEDDFDLEHFSIEKDKRYIIPVLKEIVAINPDIEIMASPWSPPAWMKTSGKLGGGSLRKEAYAALAHYFVKYIRAYAEEGITISAITIQNEPQYAAGYPSMLMSAEEQADFIKNYLGPVFKEENIQTDIIIFDHNWSTPNYPKTVLSDVQANKYITGSAFHCYEGDVYEMQGVHDAYPDKALYFTECSGGDWAPNFGDNLKWFTEKLIIGSTNNWAKSVLLWNLALNESHGPTNNGCQDCRGVVTISSSTGSIVYNEEYYAIAHASKFVENGAKRIESVSSENALIYNAFLNPDGSKVLLVLNKESDPFTFQVIEKGKRFTYSISAGTLTTFVWR